jgi:hypothetical protein
VFLSIALYVDTASPPTGTSKQAPSLTTINSANKDAAAMVVQNKLLDRYFTHAVLDSLQPSQQVCHFRPPGSKQYKKQRLINAAQYETCLSL